MQIPRQRRLNTRFDSYLVQIPGNELKDGEGSESDSEDREKSAVEDHEESWREMRSLIEKMQRTRDMNSSDLDKLTELVNEHVRLMHLLEHLLLRRLWVSFIVMFYSIFRIWSC